MIGQSRHRANNKTYIEKLAAILVETGRQSGPREARELIALIEPTTIDELGRARKAVELVLALQHQSELAVLEASILNVTRFRVSLDKRDDIVIHDDFDDEIYRLPIKQLTAVCGDSPLTSPSFRARLRQHLTLNHIILTGTELNYE